MDVRIATAALAIGLVACGSAGAPPSRAAPPPPFQTATSMAELMAWVLEPGAERVWDSAGFVITAQGETDLAPTTDEGWDAVRAGAAVVAESGNLLMMPGRSAGPAWDGFARALVETGGRAVAAAERRDADALFDAGGEIYQVCRGCHLAFWVGDDSPHAVPLP